MISMKKLMVLGASINQLGAIKAAKDMDNVRTIVVDRDPDAVGFEFADAIEVCSIRDTDKVLDLAESWGIDGVIAPCADAGLFTMGVINSELGLRGPNALSIAVSMNKRMFNDICNTFKIKTPIIYDSLEEYFFPVIIKPVDGVGSKGVYLITSFYQKPHPEELLANAKTYSSTNEAIIQQYLKGTVFNLDLLMQHGEMIYYILNDEVFEDGKNNFGVDYFVHPSTYLEYEYPIIKESLRAVNAVGIVDGNVAVEGVVVGGKVFIFEVNPRMSGGFHMETHTLASDRDWWVDGINVVLGEGVERGGCCLPIPHGWCMLGSDVAGWYHTTLNVPCSPIERAWYLKKVGVYIDSFKNSMETSTDNTVVVCYTSGDNREDVIHKLKHIKDMVKIEVVPCKS